jgi:hypothetical protein
MSERLKSTECRATSGHPSFSGFLDVIIKPLNSLRSQDHWKITSSRWSSVFECSHHGTPLLCERLTIFKYILKLIFNPEEQARDSPLRKPAPNKGTQIFNLTSLITIQIYHSCVFKFNKVIRSRSGSLAQVWRGHNRRRGFFLSMSGVDVHITSQEENRTVIHSKFRADC